MLEHEKNGPMSYFKALQREYRCELRSCGNFGLTCLVANKQHFKLNSNDLKVWNNAILQGTATIHSPPLEIHPLQSKIKRKREYHDAVRYSSEPDDYHSHRHQHDRGTVNVHIHNDSSSKHRSSKHRYYSSSPVSSPHRSSSKSVRTSSKLQPPSHQITVSLEEFIKTFVDTYPEEAPEYCLALEVLQREHCKVEQLPFFTTDMWRALNIPLGIGASLSHGLQELSKPKKHSPGI